MKKTHTPAIWAIEPSDTHGVMVATHAQRAIYAALGMSSFKRLEKIPPIETIGRLLKSTQRNI